MNGVHDMGGMHGFGPIVYEEDEPVFHHPWEGRVYAMRVSTPVQMPGGFRHVIERMEPARYLASTYYERWLDSQIRGLIEAGAFTQEEFDKQVAYYRANPQTTPPRKEDPAAVERVMTGLKRPVSHRREANSTPAFDIGDAVLTINMHPAGHTRLPQYARGKRARVVKYYGIQEFDDTMPDGEKAQPQPLYCVRFEGTELWGESAEPNSALYLDMWESYLIAL